MIKLTQHKWIVMAVSLFLGVHAGLAQWNPVEVARNNCNAYSKLINYSSDQVNQLCDQMDNNRDGSALSNNGDLTHDQAVGILQQSLAARWNTQKNINTLIPLAQQYRDAAWQYVALNPNDASAKADAQGAMDDYNKLVKWANNNSDAIWQATNKLRGQDPGTAYPDAPNKTDSSPLTDLRDTTRDAARDATQSAAQDAAQSNAKGAAHDAAPSSPTDNCPTPMH